MASRDVGALSHRVHSTPRELAEVSGVTQSKTADRHRDVARPRPSVALAEHRVGVLKIAARHQATAVRVFGSVARGDDEPGSDLDLLVTFAPGASLFDLIDMGLEIGDLLGVPVDVVSAGGLKSRHQRILDEARPL